MSVSRYNRITREIFDSNIKFKTHIPRPTDKDYKAGYIRRYFAQRTNDKSSPIFEIDKFVFEKLKSTVSYQVISLRWRISGSKIPKYDFNGNQIDKGVGNSNSITIKNKSHLIPNLKLYLPNLLQFYKM